MDAIMALYETGCMWCNQFHHTGKKRAFLQRDYYRNQNNAGMSVMNLFFPR